MLTDCRHTGSTPHVLLTNWSHAFVALAFSMHWLWCSLNIRWASTQTPSLPVASMLNLMKLFPTYIFVVRFRCRFFLKVCLQAKVASSVLVGSISSSRLSAKSILTLAQASSFLITWFTWHLVDTHPTSSTPDSRSTLVTISPTHCMSPD